VEHKTGIPLFNALFFGSDAGSGGEYSTSDDSFGSYGNSTSTSTSYHSSSVYDSSDYGDLSNMCFGVTTVVLEQYFFGMLFYDVCSFLYMWTFVRCPPLIYYRIVLPIFCCLMGVAISVLWSAITIQQQLSSALVAFCTVIPYYLNCYDYYLATAATTRFHYGFLDAVYGDFNTLINVIPGLLLVLPVLSEVNFICSLIVVLLAGTIGYGWFFVIRYKKALGEMKVSE